MSPDPGAPARSAPALLPDVLRCTVLGLHALGALAFFSTASSTGRAVVLSLLPFLTAVTVVAATR